MLSSAFSREFFFSQQNCMNIHIVVGKQVYENNTKSENFISTYFTCEKLLWAREPVSTEIPKSSAVEFSNLCCAKVCDVFAKKYSNKYAMKKSSRENADGLVQRSILKLQNNSFLIHIHMKCFARKNLVETRLVSQKRGHSNVLPASRPSILTWRRSWQLEDGTKVRGCQNDDFVFQDISTLWIFRCLKIRKVEIAWNTKSSFWHTLLTKVQLNIPKWLPRLRGEHFSYKVLLTWSWTMVSTD